MFKNAYNKSLSMIKNGAVAVAGLGASTLALAADDLATAAQAGITTAQTSGLTIGGYVIAAVAALVVVGVAIGIIKKM